MRVVVMFNPIAGAGRSAAAASHLEHALTIGGHAVDLIETRLEPSVDWLDPTLADADLLIVAGGDGAMRLAAGSAARTQTPIYHYPLGTENLFAREFGMKRSPQLLLQAIARFAICPVDLGNVNGRPFLLMTSVGLDAEVIHDLAAHRKGAITHRSYFGPIVRQIRQWKPSALTIHIEDEPVLEGESGFVVVANSRQYAWRLDPGARASMTDGSLDVVFFPARSPLATLSWVMRCYRRRQFDHPHLIHRRGSSIRVRSEADIRYQLDGDRPESVSDDVHVETLGALDLLISVQPQILRVLLP